MPHKYLFTAGAALPTCSLFRVPLQISDISEVLPDIEDLTVASEALFEIFYEEATSEITSRAEAAWLRAFYGILKTFSWGPNINLELCRPEVVPVLRVGDVVQAKYQERKNWYLGTIVSCSPDQSIFDINYDEGEKEIDVARVLIRFPVPEDLETSEPFSLQMKRAAMLLSTSYMNETYPSCTVILKRSNIVYRNSSMKLMSETLRADETMRAPIVHAYVWVRGSSLGFVMYDMELEQVHILQQKSPAAQAVRIILPYKNYFLIVLLL